MALPYVRAFDYGISLGFFESFALCISSTSSMCVCDSNQQTNNEISLPRFWCGSFPSKYTTVRCGDNGEMQKANKTQTMPKVPNIWNHGCVMMTMGGVLMIATPCRKVLCIDTKLKPPRVVGWWCGGWLVGWLGERRVAVQKDCVCFISIFGFFRKNATQLAFVVTVQ